MNIYLLNEFQISTTYILYYLRIHSINLSRGINAASRDVISSYGDAIASYGDAISLLGDAIAPVGDPVSVSREYFRVKSKGLVNRLMASRDTEMRFNNNRMGLKSGVRSTNVQ